MLLVLLLVLRGTGRGMGGGTIPWGGRGGGGQERATRAHIYTYITLYIYNPTYSMQKLSPTFSALHLVASNLGPPSTPQTASSPTLCFLVGKTPPQLVCQNRCGNGIQYLTCCFNSFETSTEYFSFHILWPAVWRKIEFWLCVYTWNLNPISARPWMGYDSYHWLLLRDDQPTQSSSPVVNLFVTFCMKKHFECKNMFRLGWKSPLQSILSM